MATKTSLLIYAPGAVPAVSDLSTLLWWTQDELQRVGMATRLLADAIAAGGVPATRTITGTGSIDGGGDLSADRTLQLVNDADTPGASYLYGTNAAGIKGWYPQPTGGSGGGIPEAPADGNDYWRNNGAWVLGNWTSLDGKPATFPPDAHTHTVADITGLQAALDGKVDLAGDTMTGDLIGPQFTLDRTLPGAGGAGLFKVITAGTSLNGIVGYTDSTSTRRWEWIYAPSTERMSLIQFNASGLVAETQILSNYGGAVELAHAGSTRLRTTGNGVDITGRLDASAGLYDGGVNINTLYAPLSHVGSGGAQHATFTATVAGFVPPPGSPTGAVLADNGTWVPRAIGTTSGNIVLKYRFNAADYVPPPAAGRVRFNNAVQNSATEAYISETTDTGADASIAYDSLRVGDYLFFSTSAGTKTFRVTGPVVDSGTYRTIPMTFLASVGANFGTNDQMEVGFVYDPASRLPQGGAAGQYLRKQSTTQYDAAWTAIPIAEVTGLQAALDGKLNLTGGTLTGPLIVDVASFGGIVVQRTAGGGGPSIQVKANAGFNAGIQFYEGGVLRNSVSRISASGALEWWGYDAAGANLHTLMTATYGGAVELRHNNVTRLATSAAGGTLTGVWNATTGLQEAGVDLSAKYAPIAALGNYVLKAGDTMSGDLAIVRNDLINGKFSVSASAINTVAFELHKTGIKRAHFAYTTDSQNFAEIRTFDTAGANGQKALRAYWNAQTELLFQDLPKLQTEIDGIKVLGRLFVEQVGTGDAFVVHDQASDNTPFVINQNGIIVIGQPAASGDTVYTHSATAPAGVFPQIQLQGANSFNSSTFAITAWNATPSAPAAFILNKGTGGVAGGVGTHTPIPAGASIGLFGFNADNGTLFVRAADIVGRAPLGATGLFVPGQIDFRVVDVAGALTERLKLTYDGQAVFSSNPVIPTAGNAVVIGHTAPIDAATYGLETVNRATAIYSYNASILSSAFDFLKSRSATIGQHAALQANDLISTQRYFGSDGAAWVNAAQILVRVPAGATVGSGVVPGRMEFSTAALTGGAPAIRLIIDADGLVSAQGDLRANAGMSYNYKGANTAASTVYQLADDTAYYQANATAARDAVTFYMPINPRNGQVVTVLTLGGLTNCVFASEPAAGQTVRNPPTNMAADTSVAFMYRQATKTWWRLY